MRVFGLLIFLLAIGLAYFTYDQFSEEFTWVTASPSQRIILLVQKDFQKLTKEHAVPPEWNQISKVTYIMNSPVTESLMGESRPELSLSPNDRTSIIGNLNYEAEVEVIDIPDEKNPGFILQISLLNIKTKNKIFEIGRSYYFKELNEKKPD